MQKARYETENLGHFGLALTDYCHFTSPIRRYPDLTIHRIISEMIDGKLVGARLKELENFVQESAERSSTTERQAEEAERTVDDQKATEFMQTKIGEVFDGVVSGVSPNGFFVELDNTVEGFVGLERLPQGRYEYNESRYMLSGMGQTYKIGARIEVRVVAVDIVLRRVDFELSNFHREDTDIETVEQFDKFEHRHNERNHNDFGERRGKKSNRRSRR
jgi:ribonuclease R